MTNLTDDELESLEYHGCSSGAPTPPLVRDAIVRATAEIRTFRKAHRDQGDVDLLVTETRLLIASTNTSQSIAGLEMNYEKMRAIVPRLLDALTEAQRETAAECIKGDDIDAELEQARAQWQGADGRADAMEKERDAYRAMLCDVLASASPNERDHPSMSRQWSRARDLLKNGPVITEMKRRELGCKCHREEGDSVCPKHPSICGASMRRDGARFPASAYPTCALPDGHDGAHSSAIPTNRFKVWTIRDGEAGTLLLRTGSSEKSSVDVDFAGTTAIDVARLACELRDHIGHQVLVKNFDTNIMTVVRVILSRIIGIGPQVEAYKVIDWTDRGLTPFALDHGDTKPGDL